jgi:hypothetical protein
MAAASGGRLKGKKQSPAPKRWKVAYQPALTKKHPETGAIVFSE